MEDQKGKKLPQWAVILIAVLIALALFCLIANMKGWKRGSDARNGNQQGSAGTVRTGDGTGRYDDDGNGNTEVNWRGSDGSSGSMVTGSGSLPADFPADFPIYTGATVTASYVAEEGGKKVQYVTWETGDSTAAVEAFYKGQLDAKGWVISANANVNDALNLVFNRAEGNDGGWLSIVRADEGTTNITAAISLDAEAGN